MRARKESLLGLVGCSGEECELGWSVEKGQKREERKRFQGEEKRGRGLFLFSLLFYFRNLFFAN
jgi:hypothetical protein